MITDLGRSLTPEMQLVSAIGWGAPLLSQQRPAGPWAPGRTQLQDQHCPFPAQALWQGCQHAVVTLPMSENGRLTLFSARKVEAWMFRAEPELQQLSFTSSGTRLFSQQ